MEDQQPAVPVSGSMLSSQLPTAVMTADVSAAAGLASINTPVSMSLLHLIMLDHNCLRAMYDAYKSPATTLDSKQLLAWNIIMALSQHAAKEEMVVYPVIRSTLGAAVADRLLGEHSSIKTMLASLDTMAATDPNFDMQLRASVDSVIAHMQEEETSWLPQLAAVLNAETQLQLGIQFEASKVRAPTRPHPEAANLPPFNETTFAAAKQVDVALDQARMPSLVPTTVGLSPLVSAALTGAAAGATADTTCGGSGQLVQFAGAAVAAGGTPTGPAGEAARTAADMAAGVVTGTPVHAAAVGGDDDMAGQEDDGMDLGDDALGAAGGMPGDLTAADAGGLEVDPNKRPMAQDLAPGGAPDEPLHTPGEGRGTA